MRGEGGGVFLILCVNLTVCSLYVCERAPCVYLYECLCLSV